jgi:uncharacterized membrane protein
MRIFDISILGWIHTVACLIALPTGLAVLAMTKGTSRHRRVGLWYFYAMGAANLTALGLYAPIKGIDPGFNRFHWMAVGTLAALAVAYVGARRQREALWAYLHPTGMIVSYYFLIGGLINEVFSRAGALQSYREPAVGLAQAANMLVFAALLIVALIGVNRRRGRLTALAA